MNVLQHTRNELNLCLQQNRPDRSYRDSLLTGFSKKPKGATNGFLVLSVMPFKRVFILHHHHTKHRYNLNRCEKISTHCLFLKCWFVESGNVSYILWNRNKIMERPSLLMPSVSRFLPRRIYLPNLHCSSAWFFFCLTYEELVTHKRVVAVVV